MFLYDNVKLKENLYDRMSFKLEDNVGVFQAHQNRNDREARDKQRINK